MPDLRNAKPTREFAVRCVVTSYCGRVLTPNLVDEMVADLLREMDQSATSWAFGKPEAAGEEG